MHHFDAEGVRIDCERNIAFTVPIQLVKNLLDLLFVLLPGRVATRVIVVLRLLFDNRLASTSKFIFKPSSYLINFSRFEDPSDFNIKISTLELRQARSTLYI
ncbi:hypothetical protein C485_18107 [Natrinema altunense JCM 12890]|uniref:Uncharacterized protein n=1 Tax=Natrinema altunense (strain JCM 12890 / CGMCC 1.3731 / AJ2) TaxID=1227494 RepID=L9ZDM1_NATA2|nr:hypothetical protein C485_18107 [Natrinema altunense JCM 12890]